MRASWDSVANVVAQEDASNKLSTRLPKDKIESHRVNDSEAAVAVNCELGYFCNFNCHRA